MLWYQTENPGAPMLNQSENAPSDAPFRDTYNSPGLLLKRLPVVGNGFSNLRHHIRQSSSGNNTKNTLLHKKAIIATKKAIQASR